MATTIADGSNAEISDLLNTAAQIARSENRPTVDVLKDALERYQQNRRLEILAARAEVRNVSARRRSSIVARAIAEYRQESADRTR